MEYNGYNIVGDGKFSYQMIKNPKGGVLPQALAGFYTSTPEAQKAVDRYLSSMERSRPKLRIKPVFKSKKEKLDARTKGSAGGK